MLIASAVTVAANNSNMSCQAFQGVLLHIWPLRVTVILAIANS